MLYKELIENNFKRLSPTEKKVGRAILDGEVDLMKDNMTKLARKLNVSPPLITKFCIKIGVSGFKEFKGIVFSSLSETANFSYRHEATLENRLSILFNSYEQKSSSIDNKLKKVADSIERSNRTIIMASEFTGDIANLFAQKLTKMGKVIKVISYDASFLKFNQDDCVIFISISGVQPKMDSFRKRLKNKTNSHYITLGTSDSTIGTTIAFSIFNKIPLGEKAIPLTVDVFLLFLLNKIVRLILEEDKDFKTFIDEVKIKNI